MSMSGQRRLELERARREALRLEQVRGECTAIAQACDALLAEVRDVAAQQLAAADLRSCAQRLEVARGAIAEQPDAARAELGRIAADIQSAIARAEGSARAWSEAQAEAVAAARHAKALAESSGGSEAATQLARDAEVRAEQGDLDASTRLASESRAASGAAASAVLDERVRREVVKGLLKTLKDMGFVVAVPRLDDGRVVLEGRLASGRRARFEVSLDGEMAFDLDGYEDRTCADDMEKMETTLRDRFGVRLGPPQVVWKNPDRISQGARDLPGGDRRKR